MFLAKNDIPANIQHLDKKEADEGLTDDERKDRSHIKEEFIKITGHQEIYWRQKARLKWLKEGDNNTKFFHSFANGCRTNNHISALEIDVL